MILEQNTIRNKALSQSESSTPTQSQSKSSTPTQSESESSTPRTTFTPQTDIKSPDFTNHQSSIYPIINELFSDLATLNLYGFPTTRHFSLLSSHLQSHQQGTVKITESLLDLYRSHRFKPLFHDQEISVELIKSPPGMDQTKMSLKQ